MDAVIAWIGRLEQLVDGGSQTVTERYRRIAAPSAMNFDNCIVRSAPLESQAAPFGSPPAELSVLAWPEVSDRGETVDDQRLATQLGAIFTLLADRRVHVAADEELVAVEGTTKKIRMPSTVEDRSLYGPMPPNVGERFESILGRICGLSSENRHAIGAAIELHYAATLSVESGPDAAYALLVAGLERLSSAYGARPPEWSLWEDAARLDGIFEDLKLSVSQRDRLREELLRNHNIRIRQTFAGYVVDRLAPDFWRQEVEDFCPNISVDPSGDSEFLGFSVLEPRPMELHVPREAEELRRRLLRSYDRRSTYVHTGARPQASDALVSLVGGTSRPTNPIGFAGLRAILRWLIECELTHRSTPAILPVVKLQHGHSVQPVPPAESSP